MSVHRRHAQFVAVEFMLRPVFLLTLFTAVIHIQTAAQDRDIDVIIDVRYYMQPQLFIIITSLYRVHRFSEPVTCDGSLSHRAHILNDSSIFSNISFVEPNARG